MRANPQNSDEDNKRSGAVQRAYSESDSWWDLLGIGVDEVSAGSCRLRLHPADAVRRWPSGPVRDGVLASLMEEAVLVALDSLDLPGMQAWVAVNLSMSLLSPTDQDVVAKAHVIQASAESATVEADIIDASGNLVAKGIVCVAPLSD